MGGSTSRAATEVVTTSRTQAQRKAQDSLAALSENSAVRRDAIEKLQKREERLAQEVGGLPIEELNSKDEALVTRMQQAMRTSQGDIQFREHLLPLPETSQTASLVSKVKEEQDDTESRYAAREATEQAGAGRIHLSVFKAVISSLQEEQRSAAAIAALAARHSCSEELLGAVARGVSVPAIHGAIVDGKHALRAVWK